MSTHLLSRVFVVGTASLVGLLACGDATSTTGGATDPSGAGTTASTDGTSAPATPTGDPTGAPTPTGTGTGSGTTPTPPGAEPSGALNGIVAAHNAVRAAVNPKPATALPPVQWSDEDAKVAQDYAAKCVFAHNPNRGPRGENIYASGGSGRTPKEVVDNWASESKNYNYAANSCSGTCGHYTQVVWRDSVKIGCAAQKCTKNSPFGGGAWEMWVCDYSPAGNFNGKKPY
jgi:pathogenesis-related protein 1